MGLGNTGSNGGEQVKKNSKSQHPNSREAPNFKNQSGEAIGKGNCGPQTDHLPEPSIAFHNLPQPTVHLPCGFRGATGEHRTSNIEHRTLNHGRLAEENRGVEKLIPSLEN
jgi:hypothetical protein